MTPEEQAEKALGSNENLRANDSGLSLNIDNFISGKLRCEFPAVVRSPVLGSVVNIFSSNRFNITGIGEFKLSAGFMKNVSRHAPPQLFQRERERRQIRGIVTMLLFFVLETSSIATDHSQQATPYWNSSENGKFQNVVISLQYPSKMCLNSVNISNISPTLHVVSLKKEPFPLKI